MLPGSSLRRKGRPAEPQIETFILKARDERKNAGEEEVSRCRRDSTQVKKNHPGQRRLADSTGPEVTSKPIRDGQ